MADDASIERAKRYYYFFVVRAVGAESAFQRRGSLFEWFYQATGFEKSGPVGNFHGLFLGQAIRDFIANGWLDAVEDEFADDYLSANEKTRQVAQYDKTFAELEKKLNVVGAGADLWLKSALSRISSKITLTELRDYVSRQREDKVAPAPVQTPREHDIDAGAWEPLKIDRASPAYADAVDASEAALREIESSNGYASSEPEERNGIIHSMRGTLEAIKQGSPSKQTVIHGLLVPLRFIAKKFAETTMGEIAKIAVAKLIALLFG